MNAARPPRLAVWLLRRFGSSPNNAAIIGDLDERYSVFDLRHLVHTNDGCLHPGRRWRFQP